MDYQALRTELQSDPAALGYTGKTDQQAADLLNAVSRTVNRGVIPSYEVINATVAAEWAALSTAEKQRYQTLTGAGQIDVHNANVVAAFAAMFAAGPTRTALLALQTTAASRATEIGLGTVTAIDVNRARGGSW